MQKPPRRAAYPVLGGRDHYACDRELGDQVARQAPWAPLGARACRAYLRDGVAWLASQGIEQFIDIGSGLPTAGNVHQIAQRVNRDARVVYVDHDPVVIAYSHALVGSDPGVAVLDADLADPGKIIKGVQEHANLIDLGRPVGLLLSAVVHFVPEVDQPRQIMGTFRAVMAPGSYVLLSHVVADDDETGRVTRAAAAGYSSAAQPFIPRTTAEITALFDGFELIPPGVHRLRLNGGESTVLGGIGVRRHAVGRPLAVAAGLT